MSDESVVVDIGDFQCFRSLSLLKSYYITIRNPSLVCQLPGNERP